MISKEEKKEMDEERKEIDKLKRRFPLHNDLALLFILKDEYYDSPWVEEDKSKIGKRIMW